MVGGGASLWGVKIVQDRTDVRERRQIEVENEREQRKLDSERPSRLRPDRIKALYDIGELLHDLRAALEPIFDRSEHDESYDWDAAAANAAGFAATARKMDIRIRLLFQGDELVNKWSSLDTALLALERTVEYGNQWVPASMLSDVAENERQTWGLIAKASQRASDEADSTDDAIKTAMAKIDTE